MKWNEIISSGIQMYFKSEIMHSARILCLEELNSSQMIVITTELYAAVSLHNYLMLDRTELMTMTPKIVG